MKHLRQREKKRRAFRILQFVVILCTILALIILKKMKNPPCSLRIKKKEKITTNFGHQLEAALCYFFKHFLSQK